jgi:hypothetical protein
MDDLSNEIKSAILSQELAGVKQQIYRLSVSAEARKLAGYTDEENKPLLVELERLVKMRDVLSGKIDELK